MKVSKVNQLKTGNRLHENMLYILQRFAGISTKKYDWPIDSSGKIGMHVSSIQYDLYDCAELKNGKIHEKAIRQVYLPLNQLFNISM